MLRPVQNREDTGQLKATKVMHPKPVQKCHLRHLSDYEELHGPSDILCISLAVWLLDSLHCSHIPCLPRLDSIWQEQSPQFHATNRWWKCMISLLILLLPNFCQRAFLGKLCSQLGLENRQLVQGKNLLAYKHIFSDEASSKIAFIFRLLLSDLSGWWNNTVEGIKLQTNWGDGHQVEIF